MPIDARNLEFDLNDSVASHWSPRHAEFSHVCNGFMALLPYLEPYFIHNLRTALEVVADPQLKTDAEGFIKQEARHAQQHRVWNQVLARRYPGFEAFESALKQKLSESKRRDSLAKRLAYTAGFEAITYQVVCFVVASRDTWLRDADPNVIAMLVWHAAEEVEHKSVAFDVYKAVHGSYWLRLWGLGSALLNTVRDLRAIAQHMLRADGLWADPACRRRYLKIRIALAKAVIPPLWQYLMPWYEPRAHVDPPLIGAWLAEYRNGRDLSALDFDALDSLGRRAQ
ncbi:MAG TPA: metal-dependent hydrolase [Polyangiales bacterium]|nr:metal-dependent hydrolase [Polyangiales bacterium]